MEKPNIKTLRKFVRPFEKADDKTDNRLRAMMRDLMEKGYLISYWADDVPDRIIFNESAYSLEF